MDAELVELAGTAGTTIVTLLATDAWEKTKIAVAGLWGKIHPDRVAAVEADLADTRTELLAAQAARDTQTKQALAGDWQRKLHRLFRDDPAAAAQLRAILDELSSVLPAGTQVWTGDVDMRAKASGNARIYQVGQGVQHITDR